MASVGADGVAELLLTIRVQSSSFSGTTLEIRVPGRLGFDRTSSRVMGSDRGQTGVRPGSNLGLTPVRPSAASTSARLSAASTDDSMLSSPTCRWNAARCITRAIELVTEGKWGTMVALQRQDLVPVPLAAVTGHVRTVPLDSDLLRTARAVGMGFGD